MPIGKHPVEIELDGREVIATGSIATPSVSSEIVLRLGDDGGPVELRISIMDVDEPQNISWGPLKGTAGKVGFLKIPFQKTLLDMSVQEFVHLGTLYGRSFYLTFVLSRIGGAGRPQTAIFHYTVTLAK